MISIALPTSGMKDKDKFFIRCLNSLWDQSMQNFEVVVTDNSEDSVIEDICNYYKTGINYYRNPIKGMAQNTNEAIRRSKGDLIKILYMDDFMAEIESLKMITKKFEGQWLVTGCTHNKMGENFTQGVHYPVYSQDMHRGVNTIGSPSVLTIKNEEPMLFDESMTWLLDADYYYRMYQKFGEPVIINSINVVIGLHDGQMTHTMGNERKLLEQQYMITKHGK